MRDLVRRVFFENWSLKITSLFLAFILWLVVRGDPTAERVISVPLEVRLPRYMEITNDRPSTVDVTVRGVFANMWFGPTLPTYTIDMQAFDEGEHVVQLTPANVRIPRASGLEAVAVRPARIKLRLERTVSKEAHVKVLTRGEPGTGIDVYDIVVSPSMVVLGGPRSSIDRIEELSTEPVSIDGQRQSIRVFANLDIRDNAVHSTPPGPVEVNVQLGPHRKLQRVTGVTVTADGAGVSIIPRQVVLQVLVPITYEKRFAPADFVAAVRLGGTDPAQNEWKLKPDVRLKNSSDPSIVIKSVTPPEVTVQRLKKG